MSTDALSPAGSSSYSSGTMTVGDGTWDSSRNDFLLPNLVGLNFATMQYNGMGNRFRDLPQYHSLIRGHAILAAIVFLGLIPLAIFIAKFGPRKHISFKLHVYIQILVVMLTTVVLVLGWFAVGPERALTNPHHGIGVALYVLVLVQFLYGWLMYKRERKRTSPPRGLPKKVWVHRLLGRSIAILGIVQVALGLTLYGSPKALFVLYALFGALLLVLYLVLDYRHKQGLATLGGHDGSDTYTDYNGSYLSGSRTELSGDGRRRSQRAEQDRKSHWGRNLLAAGGALGAYEAWKHRRSNQRGERMEERSDRRTDRRTDTESQYGNGRMSRPSSRPPPGASTMTPMRSGSRRRQSESRLSPHSWEEDEKFGGSPPRHTWRDRLVGVGAGVGAGALLGRMLSRKRKDEDYVEPGGYRPPLGGNHNLVSQTEMSHVQNGEAPFSPDRRHNHGPGATDATGMPLRPGTTAMDFTPSRPSRLGQQSTDMYSYDSRDSFEESRVNQDNHNTLRNSIATFGALAGFREWNKARKQRRDDQRIDIRRRTEMAEADRFDRRNSMNYPRRQDGRRPSVSETILTGVNHDPARGSNPELSRTNFSRVNTYAPPLPVAGGLAPPVGMVSTSSRHDNTEQGYVLPPPPPGPPPGGIRPGAYPPPIPGSAHMPMGAVEPDPSRLVEHNTLVNESSAYGRTVNSDPTVTSGRPSTGAATMMTSGQRTDSQSPSRYRPRDDSRNRMQRPEQGTFSRTSISQLGSSAAPTSPVRLHVQMHNDADGRMTIQRLPDDTPSAADAARRQERRQNRRRRTSSVSSGLESDAPPGSNRRYRRTGPSGVRPSSQQPITNVPPPPAMSSVAGSNRPPSELNLPPPPKVPNHSESPQSIGMSPPVRPPIPMTGSNMSNAVGSPSGGAYGTDAGTGTDLSAFADNRKRRRAERARKQQGQRVEFE